MNSEKYTYRVQWSESNQEYVGTVAEFPSLSWLDKDISKALGGIVDLVGEVVADMEDNGEQVPQPLTMREYSGRFMVRTTPEMHMKLTAEAAEEHVSLNRLVNARIASEPVVLAEA